MHSTEGWLGILLGDRKAAALGPPGPQDPHPSCAEQPS